MKVSVIVPVYNVAKYLKKCLDSLVNQTLKEIEIIIVNDGSTDNSQITINKYKRKYKNIKAYNKKNGGLSDARNYGLKKATGEYVGFVDGDDYVELDMYEKMYNAAVINKSDLVTCDFKWVYPNKIKLDIQNENLTKEELMVNIRVIACNKLIKKEVLDDKKITFEKGLRYEDVLFTYMLLPNVKKVYYINECLYNYVQRQKSISNLQNEKVRDIFLIFDKIIKYYKDKNIYDQNKNIIEYLHVRYFLGSSFLRIIKIKDKSLREGILNENWLLLNSKFPDWKSNCYLKNLPGKKNIYYRHMNKFIYHISAFIFNIRGEFSK